MEDGIYHDIPEAEYHALPYVSQSMIKAFLHSPESCWRNYVSDDRNSNDTASKDFGSALHSACLLGWDHMLKTFAPAFDPSHYPDALNTVADIKGLLKDNGLKVSGTKSDLKERLLSSGVDAQFIDDIRADHEDGRTIISAWSNLEELYNVIDVYGVYKKGEKEITIIWTDEATGLKCKCRLDFVGDVIRDLKTIKLQQFSSRSAQNQCIQRICDARYDLQAVWYSDAYFSATGIRKEFVFDFIETGETNPYFKPMRFPVHDGERHHGMAAMARSDLDSALSEIKSMYDKFEKRAWRETLDHTLDADDFPAYFAAR